MTDDRNIFEQTAALLETILSDDEFVLLAEALDGDPESQLLDAINKLLSKTSRRYSVEMLRGQRRG